LIDVVVVVEMEMMMRRTTLVDVMSTVVASLHQQAMLEAATSVTRRS